MRGKGSWPFIGIVAPYLAIKEPSRAVPHLRGAVVLFIGIKALYLAIKEPSCAVPHH